MICPGWTNTRLVYRNVLGTITGTIAENANPIGRKKNIQKRIVESD